MRVTSFHYIYKNGAPLVQVSELTRAFRSLGHEVLLHGMDAGPAPSPRMHIKERLKRVVGRYLHEANTLRKTWSYYRRELRIVRQERPDLILTRYKLYHSSCAWVARRCRLPLVLWVDAPAAYEQRKYLREFVQMPGVAEGVERYLLRRADKAIVVSDEIKPYLAGGRHRNGRIEVVPNGVDTEQFSPSLDGRAIRAMFPVPNPLVLGFVGSFAPWHGMESLKSLVAFARNTSDRSCFLLVGDGPRRAEVEAFIQAGGWDARRVRFTGNVDHDRVPTYVAAMDVCLLPYDQGSEGFYFSPLKLFEYMACGKPVLASRVGQVEQVIQDGVNGLCYSAADERETAAKLKALIEQPELRQRLGEAGRRTVLERYTWRHTALAVQRILEEVLANRRVGG